MTDSDIEWLTKFESARSQAAPILQKITAASDVSDEVLLRALREATEKIPQYLQAMKDVPKPKSKEYRKSRDDMLSGLEFYIRGCRSHIKWFETGKRWYISEMQTLISEAEKKFENSKQWLLKASK
jgi:hypothetical protein